MYPADRPMSCCHFHQQVNPINTAGDERGEKQSTRKNRRTKASGRGRENEKNGRREREREGEIERGGEKPEGIQSNRIGAGGKTAERMTWKDNTGNAPRIEAEKRETQWCSRN